MKIISICNQKGGVGKTTTAQNLAAGLAVQGKTVLCIDFDPQGNLSECLGHEPDELPTVTELLLDAVRGGTLDPACAIRRNAEDLCYIPADIRLSGAELFLSQAMFREQMLRRVLGKLPPFDYIIIDCLPSLGILLTNALLAADSVLIPVQAQKLALSGLDDLLNTVDLVRQQGNPKLEILGILLTMVDETNMSKAVNSDLRQRFDTLMFETAIRRSVEATNSSYAQQSLIHTRNSKLGEQYSQVVAELLARERDPL